MYQHKDDNIIQRTQIYTVFIIDRRFDIASNSPKTTPMDPQNRSSVSQKEGNSLVCINTKIIIPYQKHKNTVFIIDSRNCIINQLSKAVTGVLKLRVEQWAFGIF